MVQLASSTILQMGDIPYCNPQARREAPLSLPPDSPSVTNLSLTTHSPAQVLDYVQQPSPPTPLTNPSPVGTEVLLSRLPRQVSCILHSHTLPQQVHRHTLTPQWLARRDHLPPRHLQWTIRGDMPVLSVDGAVRAMPSRQTVQHLFPTVAALRATNVGLSTRNCLLTLGVLVSHRAAIT